MEKVAATKVQQVTINTAIAYSDGAVAARAQQPTMPVIGYLYAGSPEAGAHLAVAFRQGLGESGSVT